MPGLRHRQLLQALPFIQVYPMPEPDEGAHTFERTSYGGDWGESIGSLDSTDASISIDRRWQNVIVDEKVERDVFEARPSAENRDEVQQVDSPYPSELDDLSLEYTQESTSASNDPFAATLRDVKNPNRLGDTAERPTQTGDNARNTTKETAAAGLPLSSLADHVHDVPKGNPSTGLQVASSQLKPSIPPSTSKTKAHTGGRGQSMTTSLMQRAPKRSFGGKSTTKL